MTDVRRRRWRTSVALTGHDVVITVRLTERDSRCIA